MFRFTVKGTVIDKYDRTFPIKKRPFTGKTAKAAINQFKHCVHDKYGFKVLIRDIVAEEIKGAK